VDHSVRGHDAVGGGVSLNNLGNENEHVKLTTITICTRYLHDQYQDLVMTTFEFGDLYHTLLSPTIIIMFVAESFPCFLREGTTLTFGQQ
jgi:hypothetical protein